MRKPQSSPAGFTASVLDDTWSEFQKALKDVPFSLWNESTFRWFYIKSARKLFRDVRMHIEWDRFDLLAQLDGHNHLIEFKFFVPNRRIYLDRKPGGWKGGPVPKNFEEFQKCVKDLHEADAKYGHRFKERSLIMVFPDDPSWKGKQEGRSYRRWYSPLADFELKEVLRPSFLPTFEHSCSIDGSGADQTLTLHCIQFDFR